MTQKILHLIRLFHSASGIRPLDAIVGVTNAKCATKKGPIIRTYVQRHPVDPDRCVIVTTLKDYLSDEFVTTLRDGTETVPFKRNKNGSYIRISSRQEDSILELAEMHNRIGEIRYRPGLIFGNDMNRIKIQESDLHIGNHEADLLDLTTRLYQVIDSVYESCLNLLQSKIVEMNANDNMLTYETIPLYDNLDIGWSEKPFVFPIGNKIIKPHECNYDNIRNGKRPHDLPDTIVSHVSVNSPYTAHSDTNPMKLGTHNNDIVASHALFMRILTHGIVTSPDDETLLPQAKVLVNLKHGLREGRQQKLTYCELIGYFDGASGKWVPANKNESIPIGGKSHAHLQYLGTQGSLQHEIKKATNLLIARAVYSARSMINFILTPEIQLRHYGRYLPVNPYTNHRYQGVINHLLHGANIQTIRQNNSSTTEWITMKSPSMHSSGKQFISGVHKNGKLRSCEKPIRMDIKGMPHRITMENIARGEHNTNCLYSRQTSIVLNRGTGLDSVRVGPATDVTSDGTRILVRPGTKFEATEIDEQYHFNPKKTFKNIVNENRMDVIHTRHISKNHPSLAYNLKVALSQNPSLEFIPMCVSSIGGSQMDAGEQALDPSNANSSRTGTTHFVSLFQDYTNSINLAMMKTVGHHQSVLHYHEGVYTGVWIARKMFFGGSDTDEFEKEMKEFRRLLPELHQLDKTLFPAPELTRDQCKQIVSSRAGRALWLLAPLDRYFPSLWKHRAIVPWNEKHMDLSMFIAPVMVFPDGVPRDVEDYTNPDSIHTWEDMLTKNKSKLSHITQHGQNILNSNETNAEIDQDDIQDENDEFNEQDIQFDQYLNAMFHVAAFTMERACGDCVKIGQNSIMHPPRGIYESINDDDDDKAYQSWIDEHNFKLLMTRPVHPPDLGMDISAYGAAYDTNSFENDSIGQRCGSQFFTDPETEDMAFAIFFKSLIWSLTNPSVMLQLYFSPAGEEKWNTYAPLPDEICQYTEAIRKFQWSSRLLHPIFRSTFCDGNDYIGWVHAIAVIGKRLIKMAIINGQGEKEKTAQLLKMYLNYVRDKCFSSFQVQVIMRNVEHCCLVTPFGSGSHVDGGYGSRSGAKSLLKTCLKYFEHKPLVMIPDTINEQLARVPEWIVIMRNDRVRNRLQNENPAVVLRMRDELEVCNLDWSEDEDCLVHKMGPRRKYSASDAEHSLCALYGLLISVRPERNVSVRTNIDHIKYPPLRMATKKCLAKDLELMEYFLGRYDIVRSTYQKLLDDEDYEFRNLDGVFKLDVFEEDVVV